MFPLNTDCRLQEILANLHQKRGEILAEISCQLSAAASSAATFPSKSELSSCYVDKLDKIGTDRKKGRGTAGWDCSGRQLGSSMVSAPLYGENEDLSEVLERSSWMDSRKRRTLKVEVSLRGFGNDSRTGYFVLIELSRFMSVMHLTASRSCIESVDFRGWPLLP
jgi:hypothetical protein